MAHLNAQFALHHDGVLEEGISFPGLPLHLGQTAAVHPNRELERSPRLGRSRSALPVNVAALGIAKVALGRITETCDWLGNCGRPLG